MSVHALFAVASFLSLTFASDLISAIHEAYAPPIDERRLFIAIEKTPPPSIIEEPIGEQGDDLVWIRGYWRFEPTKNRYEWVSGVRRRKPQGMRWEEGQWRRMEEGWVWLSGFWYPEATPLQFLSQIPPQSLEEGNFQEIRKKNIHLTGNWRFDGQHDRFQWTEGHDIPFEAAQVPIASHFRYRPEGFIEIHSYWDHPLEERGTSYHRLESGERELLTSQQVVDELLATYPDHLTSLRHYALSHPDEWKENSKVVSWLKDNRGWNLDHNRQWQLFWWHTHSDVKKPRWFKDDLERLFPLANQDQIAMVASVTPPIGFTSQEFISQEELIDLLEARAEAKLGRRPNLIPHLVLRPEWVVVLEEEARHQTAEEAERAHKLQQKTVGQLTLTSIPGEEKGRRCIKKLPAPPLGLDPRYSQDSCRPFYRERCEKRAVKRVAPPLQCPFPSKKPIYPSQQPSILHQEVKNSEKKSPKESERVKGGEKIEAPVPPPPPTIEPKAPVKEKTPNRATNEEKQKPSIKESKEPETPKGGGSFWDKVRHWFE